jgi:hypothetical protein
MLQRVRCRRWILLGVASVWLGGCRPAAEAVSAPPAPDASAVAVQSRILLDDWSRSGGGPLPGAAADDPCEPRAPETFETAFHLPADRRNAGATLVLPGLWWRATVTINDRQLAPVDSGLGTAEIRVGDDLVSGENRLRIVVEEPTDQPRVVTNGCLQTAALGDGVQLVLHPEAWIRDGALIADGESVGAAVRIRGGLPGARVHVEAWLDGERLEWGGSGVVDADGIARVPAAAWPGPRWRLDDADGSGLVHLAATLVDGAEQVLDRTTVRAGVRQLTFEDGQLLLDRAPFRMMAIRAELDRRPHAQLLEWRGVGINALEVHGRTPSSAWLAEADELGLPVVVLPRCDGPLWTGVQPRQRRQQLEQWSAELAAQDREIAWRAAAHPSLSLWACEGDRDVAVALCGNLTALDPRATPAAGVQLGSWPLQAEGLREAGRGGGPGPVAVEPGWIVELTGATEQVGAARAATTFVEACQQGAVGGVIPPPGAPAARADWQRAWSDAARELAVPPLDSGERRAGARLRVRGLEVGHIAWLEAPGLTPVGGVVGRDGTVTLEAWHRGLVTVAVDGVTRQIELAPDAWRDLARISASVDLDWGAAPAER